tara:strand:- start:102 stop:386 length:285 start_codon:yes stop_codon:yes gene_type:complete
MIISREKVSISRSEWQCYIDTPDSVIDIINEEFSEILLTTTSPVYAQKRIYDFCEKYKEWGFSDSECNQMATDVINQYYKSDINRWQMFSVPLQ